MGSKMGVTRIIGSVCWSWEQRREERGKGGVRGVGWILGCLVRGSERVAGSRLWGWGSFRMGRWNWGVVVERLLFSKGGVWF